MIGRLVFFPGDIQNTKISMKLNSLIDFIDYCIEDTIKVFLYFNFNFQNNSNI